MTASNDDTPLSREPMHDTESAEPAYALFAHRPIAPQPRDVLAADPRQTEPLPPSGTENTPTPSACFRASERINPDQLP
jgi:hypothetical protein